MRVYYGFDSLPRFTHPAATVGSYDGVHSGHRVLLRTVADTALSQGGESVVFTFEPHPRVTLGRAEGLRLLTSLEEKCYLLAREGIDNLVVIPFDAAFSRLSADEFIGDRLVGRAGVETLVVGFNHRFGHDKQGSYDYLGSRDFDLRVVEVPECDVDACKVSSTVIRQLVAQGEMARAARMLGHPYLVIGTARQGRIRLGEALKLLPPPGEYAVRIAPFDPAAQRSGTPPDTARTTGKAEFGVTRAAEAPAQALAGTFTAEDREPTPSYADETPESGCVSPLFKTPEAVCGRRSNATETGAGCAQALSVSPEILQYAEQTLPEHDPLLAGRPARLKIETSENLIIADGSPDGPVVITF